MDCNEFLLSYISRLSLIRLYALFLYPFLYFTLFACLSPLSLFVILLLFLCFHLCVCVCPLWSLWSLPPPPPSLFASISLNVSLSLFYTFTFSYIHASYVLCHLSINMTIQYLHAVCIKMDSHTSIPPPR